MVNKSRSRRKSHQDKGRSRKIRRTARVKKSSIPMKVHQIFYNIGKGELKDIPAFKKGYDADKAYCRKHGIQYKLWSRKQVEALLEKPKNKEYKKLYYDFREDIQRIDFARYMILWNFGGIYIDLDICIIKNKSIKSLFANDYFFVKWHDKSKLPYNAVLGTKPDNPLYKDILDHSRDSFYEKRKDPIYKTWKARFVFQTTGHFMLQRVLKKHKITEFKDVMKIHTKEGKTVCNLPQKNCPDALFEDSSASVWFDGKK